jgi:tetratricopeptide (TPR) repeat protein
VIGATEFGPERFGAERFGPESWLKQLRNDRVGAVRALLDGTASLGALSAAELDDAIDALLGGLDRGHPTFIDFDQACLVLLDEFTQDFSKVGLVFDDTKLARLRKLVSLVVRLLPPATSTDLHIRHEYWGGFFENFVLDRSFDLRREFFRILALTQSEAAAAGLPARRLMPLWLFICSHSGDAAKYDASYLRIGLLGLRRLPLGDEDSANEDFALRGLVSWAVSQCPGVDAFEREWRIFEDVYPRAADFWQARVAAVLPSIESGAVEAEQRSEGQAAAAKLRAISSWWRDDLEVDAIGVRALGRVTHSPPSKEKLDAILAALGSPIAGLESKVKTHIEQHRRYADSSGDVYYLIRTACNIGMKILKQELDDKKSGELAFDLARTAFEYDPVNVYAWSLMRDALAAAGRVADAELVGWEAIRRFPENEQWRNQLATLLVSYSGEVDEAIALLRDSIITFPNDPYVYGQLATVLAGELQDVDGARAVLEDASRRGVKNEVISDIRRRLEVGRPFRSTRGSKAKTEDPSRLKIASAEARKLLFRYETKRISSDELSLALLNGGHDAYVGYVAVRTGLRPTSINGPFALAFEAALARAEPSALRALVAQARPLEREIVQAAIQSSEGRVVAFDRALVAADQTGRLRTLSKSMSGAGADKVHRLSLLRDFAASSLSSDFVRGLAA